MKRQKHRNFPVVVQEKPCLGQAEIRSQKFQCGPPVDIWSPSSCTICCLPRHVVRKLGEKLIGQGSKWCSDMGYHKQHLALLLVNKTNPI